MLTFLISTGIYAKNKSNSKICSLINKEQLLQKRNLTLSDSKALSELLTKSDKLLNNKVFSVTFKSSLPPSGDKHDYMTIAPYFWPDSTKADGKPYIRKDGEVNPESRNGATDYVEFESFVSTVNTLSKAAFITKDKKYSKKAVQLLDAWFVDKATKMNPNLNYGQAVPGENLGRPFGVIEMMGLVDVMKAIETLELIGYLDKNQKMLYNTWFESYALWLTTSELGIQESTRENNHGTNYDVQLCSIYIYLQKNKEAKALLENVKANRIDVQIAPDGSQPHELERTKSMSYSSMNLSAFTTLAIYGKKLGVDLWNYKSADNSSIQNAYFFLSKALDENQKWEYKQITDAKKVKAKIAEMFVSTGKEFKNSVLVEIGNAYLSNVK